MILIVVLGVLSLLTLMSMALVSTTQLERSVASNYVDGVRARLAAESGLQHAARHVQTEWTGTPSAAELRDVLYYHDDEGRMAVPDLSDPAAQPSLTRAAANPAEAMPVSGAIGGTWSAGGDSFRLRIEDESGKLNVNDDTRNADVIAAGIPPRRLTDVLDAMATRAGLRPFSDALFAARGALPGDRFDSSSQLRAVLARDCGFAEDELRRLDRLLTVHSWRDPNVLEPTCAIDRVHNNDPTVVLPDGLPDFMFKRSHGGPAPATPQDGIVFRFRGAEWGSPIERISPERDDFYDIQSDVASSKTAGRDVYLYLDMQTAHFATTSRAPVHLNSASPALLAAMLAPVRGWFLEENVREERSFFSPGSMVVNGSWGTCMADLWHQFHYQGMWEGPVYVPKNLYYEEADNAFLQGYYAPNRKPAYVGRNSAYGELKLTKPLGSIADELAARLWKRAHRGDPEYDFDKDGKPDAEPSPFTDWQEFADFVRSLVDDKESKDAIPQAYSIPGFDYYQADAVIANCNPNSGINDYNPDSLLYKHVDKSQLIAHGGEFCLEPTGAFRMESIGTVVAADGTVRARARQEMIVQAYEMLRLTTQQQFTRGYAGTHPNPDRLYHDAANTGGCVAESNDLFPAAGATGRRRGYSMMTYPEPITVHRDAADLLRSPAWHGATPGGKNYADDDWNYLDDSKYDGYIGLATLQPTVQNMTFGGGFFTGSAGFYADDGGLGNNAGPAPTGIAPSCQLTCNASLRLNSIAPGATRQMAGGYGPFGEVLADNVNPGYPAKTFTRSAWNVYYDYYAGFFGRLWVGWPQYGLDFPEIVCCNVHAFLPTPQNFPTVDRLTYPYPEKPADIRSAAARRIPGVLLPDGALSDLGRTISFDARNVGTTAVNQEGKIGSLMMWVKPNFDPANSRLRTMFSMHRPANFHYTQRRANPEGSFELFYLCRRGIAGSSNVFSGTIDQGNGDARWAPVNCFFMSTEGLSTGRSGPGFFNPNYERRMSGTANHSYEGSVYQATPDGDGSKLYNFESHKWNHIGISWHYPAGENRIVINARRAFTRGGFGGYVSETAGVMSNWHRDVYGGGPVTPPDVIGYDAVSAKWGDQFTNVILSPDGEEMRLDPVNYVRLGGLSSDFARNYAADSTYDEVTGYAAQLTEDQMKRLYCEQGRYYGNSLVSGKAGFYCSPEIDVRRELGLSPNMTLTPRSASWTVYWPIQNGYAYESGNRSAANGDVFQSLHATMLNPADRPAKRIPLRAGPGPRAGASSSGEGETDPGTEPGADPDASAPRADPLAMDFLVTGRREGWFYAGTGDPYGRSAASTGAMRYTKMATCSYGSDIRRDADNRAVRVLPGERFRFRAIFNLDLSGGEHVYETPVLDDVTVTFLAATPRVLEFRVVE